MAEHTGRMLETYDKVRDYGGGYAVGDIVMSETGKPYIAFQKAHPKTSCHWKAYHAAEDTESGAWDE